MDQGVQMSLRLMQYFGCCDKVRLGLVTSRCTHGRWKLKICTSWSMSPSHTPKHTCYVLERCWSLVASVLAGGTAMIVKEWACRFLSLLFCQILWGADISVAICLIDGKQIDIRVFCMLIRWSCMWWNWGWCPSYAQFQMQNVAHLMADVWYEKAWALLKPVASAWSLDWAPRCFAILFSFMLRINFG